MRVTPLFLSAAVLLVCGRCISEVDGLQVGLGIHDSTGPIEDVVFMGMANPSQKGTGLHQRLRARAFVAYDEKSDKRFAFVSIDSGMGGIVLKNRVLASLRAANLSTFYHDENVAISGTHTHSGPSGFLQNVLFQFSGSGWVPATLDAMAEGIFQSIYKAHNNLEAASASVSVGTLDNASINRSPTAYLRNPQAERDEYKDMGDRDLNMTLLKFTASGPGKDATSLGMFNWFAVHPNTMNNTNTLVSGDNKGYASYLFEKKMNPPGTRTGQGPYVAAFATTNLGDISPNTKGPHCRDTGLPCDVAHSTCNGKTEQCSAFGPGKDMFESCEIIGKRQFDKAEELFNGPSVDIGGEVDYIHTYVTMPGLSVVADPSTGTPAGKLCKAAMGDSFAAGTIDGPGMFDFTQGANSSNPFWHFIVGFIHKSTPEEKACQEPKGILLPTGSISFPWPWAEDVLPVQLLRLGQLVIVVVPTEMTTMAGRRMRKAIKSRLVAQGVLREADAHVVIAGLSNGYADYTTTYEEYQEQRYEGGSTIYGPHQLQGYIQEASKLADAMATGKSLPSSTPPADFSDKCINTGPSLGSDKLPSGAKAFGDVLHDVAAKYAPGDIATVTFAGGNPLNNLRTQGTFLEIQRCDDATCTTAARVADDGDWETRLNIIKTKKDVVFHSRSWQVSWYIPSDVAEGMYRIVHYGTSRDKPLVGSARLNEYNGTSSIFKVSA